MTQNEHVYAICYRLEVVDAISCENVKTVDGYAVLNVEVASFSSFQVRYSQKSFRDGGGGGAGRRRRIRVSAKK